jgi:hypothetical protein
MGLDSIFDWKEIVDVSNKNNSEQGKAAQYADRLNDYLKFRTN